MTRAKTFKNLDWSAVEDKFFDKTQEFIKALENGTNEVIYIEDEGGTGYYDLVAVEMNGKYNAVPLPVLLRMFHFNEDADIYDLMGLLEQSFRNMTRDEYEEMIERKRLEEETSKFFRLHSIVEVLRGGEELVLETSDNQYSEEIATHTLYLNGDGLFEESRLNCWSSSSCGLGTCQCVSHDPYLTEVISPEVAVRLIREYVEKTVEEEEEKKRQLAKIDFVLAELSKM